MRSFKILFKIKKIGKVHSKGNCSTCEMRKTMKAKLEKFKISAKLRQEKIVNYDHFKKNIDSNTKKDQNLNKKLGFLQRANILYSKERYLEAFNVICKAVEIVKDDLENLEENEKKIETKWKTKIGIEQGKIS